MSWDKDFIHLVLSDCTDLKSVLGKNFELYFLLYIMGKCIMCHSLKHEIKLQNHSKQDSREFTFLGLYLAELELKSENSEGWHKCKMSMHV